MKHYKNIKYLIQNGLIDLGLRQVKRRAKELFSVSDPSVKFNKNSKNINEYLIDLNFLEKFQRKRAPKKTVSKPISEKNNSEVKREIQNPYNTNISINIKSDDIAKFSIYDYKYNDFIARTIFNELNMDLYFVVEQEEKSVNHFHLHLGLDRGNLTIRDIRNKIEDILFNNFYISNEVYTDSFGCQKSIIYVEEMISDFANRQYIGKGVDKLGGVVPNFLTVKKSLNAT
ncbi:MULTISPECIES: hypothetical protein [Empedobacter]|uniref:hypothetical protein n=1 Tax=Empedobacter TaxID=59734 RepID=UPI0025B935BA|nr:MULTISPECIES: hypothetical protein [unclassified Empedobacter]